jgi:hypothetical protein
MEKSNTTIRSQEQHGNKIVIKQSTLLVSTVSLMYQKLFVDVDVHPIMTETETVMSLQLIVPTISINCSNYFN